MKSCNPIPGSALAATRLFDNKIAQDLEIGSLFLSRFSYRKTSLEEKPQSKILKTNIHRLRMMKFQKKPDSGKFQGSYGQRQKTRN